MFIDNVLFKNPLGENIIDIKIDRNISDLTDVSEEDKKMLDKIDNLFKKINDFEDKFTDVNEFEKEFANSSLNNEYINIFVELSKDGAPSIGETILESAASEVVSAAMPSRAVIADKRDEVIRDIPVVGNIMQAGQTIDFFNKFRKKK